METHIDPHALLEAEFARRTARNPRYSRRAFAKQLKISPSLLSLIFARKRRIGPVLLARLESKLSLAPDQAAQLQAAIGNDFTQNAAPALTNYEPLSDDAFAMLADWYHYAILSLLETPDASLKPDWIASRLGIPVGKAREAIARLKRLQLVGKVDGKWKQVTRPLKVENKDTSAATRKHHRQVLLKAGRAMKKEPFDRRDLSSITFAMNPLDVPYARMRIRQFRRQLVRELEQRGKASEVYHLAVQIYPVSVRPKN